MRARKPALGAGGARGGQHEIGKAGAVGLGFEHQRVGLLIGEHVLAEGGAQSREPLADRREAGTCGAVKAGAGAGEIKMVAFQHAQLFGAERKFVAPAVERIDAREQRLIEQNGGPMPRAARGIFALQRKDLVVDMRVRQRAEHVAHARERPSAALQRRDAVVETRRGWIGGDRRDLGIVIGKAALERFPEVCRRDAPERRHAEGAGPVLEERIVRAAGWGGGILRIGHAR